MSQDSAKLLSEKLALTREVAVLRPEIEHLQSQLTHQKDVLAEKLALERQLNALEVELANERRAAQKVAQRQDRESQEEAELRKQVQDLEKQLAKERKASQKNLQQQENQHNEVESELEALREQLTAAENNLAAEKRKTERLAKTKSSKTSEVEQELEQLRLNLADAEKALAAEKRAAQRQATTQDNKSNEAEEALVELQEELADERKEKTKLQKEHKQFVAEAEAQQEAYRSKLEKFKTKLRETQEELKQSRTELEKAREQTVTIPKVTTTTVPIKNAAAKGPAKRKRAAEISEQPAVLQTPDGSDKTKRPLKKRGFDPSIVEKSTFSITPFLNKTINLSDGSPKPIGEEATRTLPVFNFRNGENTTATNSTSAETNPSAAEEEAGAEAEAPAPEAAVETKKPRGRPKALADAPPSKKNLTAKVRKAPSLESTLEKVMEEPDEADQGQENRSVQSTGTAKSVSSVAAEPEQKKKKRKLLGSSNKPTLFDEDEDEKVVPAKRPPKAGLGVRKMGAAGVKSAFAGASFSPLKRDRRGVGASFLA